MALTSAPRRGDERPSSSAGSAPKPAPRTSEPRVSRPAPTGRWALIIAGGYAAGLAADASGVPAPYLLSSLLVGALLALCGVVRDRLPAPANRVSQAVVGALMGSYLTPSALVSAAPVALPLTVVTAATIALSLLVAWFLARGGRISRPSAVLGMVPGGSAAIVTCADELKADVRLVAFTQYLRVGLVATTAPLAAHWMISASSAAGGHPVAGGGAGSGLLHVVAGSDQLTGLFTLATIAVAGSWAGRRLRVPTPLLIGPMLVALVATLSGVVPGFAPVGVGQNAVFVLVGLDVGLRFTRQTLRSMRRLLPSILVCMVVVCLGCAGLAWVFAGVTGTPVTDAYLATTPGGINAVLAAAVSSHADVALVSTVQSLRLLVVILVTPMITRMLAARWSKPVGVSETSAALGTFPAPRSSTVSRPPTRV